MISEITYVLLSDGSSDMALMPIIDWTLLQVYPQLVVQRTRADLSRLRHPPKDLVGRIHKALALQPCDILFIHRDSERESLTDRKDEIDEAVNQLNLAQEGPLTVPIIPIRMLEAWLLIDELAIKTAAGNPNGRYRLVLPPPRSLESLPDPKSVLREHLRHASGLKGRQLDKFNVGRAVHLVAENISNFSVLKQLSAYQHFEKEISTKLLHNLR